MIQELVWDSKGGINRNAEQMRMDEPCRSCYSNLMGPDGWKRHISFELTEHGQPDVLGVTPPQGRGAHTLAVDGAHTVWEAVAACLA